MSRAAKAEAAIRKQKDARQKKMLIALAPLFLGLVAWQGPGILKAFSGSPPPPPPAAAPAATTPASTDPAAGAPSTAAPGVTPPPASPSRSLPNTDEPVPPDEGQLVSFDRFVGKDPFRQQVSATDETDGGGGATTGGASTGGATTGGATTGGSGNDGADDNGNGGTTPPAFTPPADGDGDGSPDPDDDLVATLDVNGTSQFVTVGSTFPTTEPIFRLVSLKARSARMGLVAGAFSTGARTITLKLGKPMTFVSQPDGVQYTITLRRVG